MSIKITNLEIENVKRVKAVRLAPGETGLTIIGGKNGQGKTSVLDAIAWALGGEKFRPSGPAREGSVLAPNIQIKLSNGLVVERAGKNSALKVTDPSGRASGQALLNEFVERLALNLPAFLAASAKEKASTLLGMDTWPPRTFVRAAMLAYKQAEARGQIQALKIAIGRHSGCAQVRYLSAIPHEWMLQELGDLKRRIEEQGEQITLEEVRM